MEKRRYLSLHLILDVVSSEEVIDDFADELAKIREVQVWVVKESIIKVGRIPNVFNEIPLHNIKYCNGWLTIEASKEPHIALATHIFVVFKAQRESEIRKKIKALQESFRLSLREML